MDQLFSQSPWEKQLRKFKPQVWKPRSVFFEKYLDILTCEEVKMVFGVFTFIITIVGAMMVIAHLSIKTPTVWSPYWGLFSTPLFLWILRFHAQRIEPLTGEQFRYLELQSKSNAILEACLTEWMAENRVICQKQFRKIKQWIRFVAQQKEKNESLEKSWNQSHLKVLTERHRLEKAVPQTSNVSSSTARL